MNNITMKHLRYFEALARFGHFGRAADACAISQPALSVQMKELEAILGAPLVERGPRHVRLTSLGETLADRARDILRAVDELDELVRAAHDELAGKLRIGVIPTIAPYLLPAFIKALSVQYPAIDPRPREAVTGTLVQALKAGQLDVAIVALPISESTLVEQALFTEEFVLVRPAEDRDKPVPSTEGLRDMRLLLLEEGHCFRDQALSFCNLSPTVSRDMMEGSTLGTLVQMVGVGIGVTLLPHMAVPVETRSAPVAVQRLAAPRPQRTIGMIWRKSSPLSGQMGKMADLLRDCAPSRQGDDWTPAGQSA